MPHSSVHALHERMSEEEIADLLGITVRQLRQNRWRSIGPAYEKVGRTILYRCVDVESWLERHRIDPEAV